MHFRNADSLSLSLFIGGNSPDTDPTGSDVRPLAALRWEAQDNKEAVEGIQRGLDDFEAGRFRSFDEFAEEQRRKYNLPIDS